MNAKIIKKIQVGSNVFFNKFKDYEPHDFDYVCKLDKPLFGKQIFTIKNNKLDYILIYWENKEDLINQINEPIQAGKFLVPEFVEYIGFTIDDLIKLKQWFYKLDKKHHYQLLIFNSYINNNGFFLTEEQLQKIYTEYKKDRC